MDHFDEETQNIVNEIARNHHRRRQIGAHNPPPEERIERPLVHTSALSGMNWVMELVNSNNSRIHDSFRMSSPVFLRLCETLKENYGLTSSTRFNHVEGVAIFLFLISQGAGYRQAAERFQHSTSTISTKFHQVKEALLLFSRDQIYADVNAEVHPHISNIDMYYPHFKDCIGGIDGTHVRAILSQDTSVPFINRKGTPTQNVLGVCDFNMCFTFVSTGWEGSMHDARILGIILRNAVEYSFPTPPEGKYYLVDSGYTNMKGYLAPYKGDRYHLPVFRNGNHPRNAEEIFNKWHASLRSVIERSFGVLKKRFQILDRMPSFLFQYQPEIVAITMALHNFIRRSDREDFYFRAQSVINERNVINAGNNDASTSSTQMRADAYMDNVRNQICQSISGIGE